MKPVDLTGLIKGLLVVIGISIALGKYEQLSAWARKEAFGVPKMNHRQSAHNRLR